ncbi:MAG: hypothetical protein RMK52_06510 [Chitinophagales bacterium]|nr:hypothetical protein [Chitinophagales bacterium]MDW8393879.1 hypothetical protein [Chitinophagales bacterium]
MKYLAGTVALLLLVACTHQAGEIIVPNFELRIHVIHHSWPVPNCKVYLKRNTTHWPGPDPRRYDDSTVSNGAGFCSFDSLYYGDYYLYGIGWDKLEADSVTGNSHVRLSRYNVADGICDTILWVSESAPH